MSKEDQIIEMLGEVAIQATQQIIESEERLGARIDGVDSRLTTVDQHLTAKIEDVEQRLTVRIEDVEQRLTIKIVDVEQRLTARIDGVEERLDTKMDALRYDNATFHDEIVGYLKRAEQERVFTSEHLKRLDHEVEQMRRTR